MEISMRRVSNIANLQFYPQTNQSNCTFVSCLMQALINNNDVLKSFKITGAGQNLFSVEITENL